MIQALSGTEALARRQAVKSAGTGLVHWGASYFGPRHSNAAANVIGPDPQSLCTDMAPGEVIKAHFHCVSQFQIYAAGAALLGRHPVQPIIVQFLDHHTAYGPITASPQGFSFFAMRTKTDSGPVYLDKPGYKEVLRPSKRRSPLSAPLVLSTEPVLENRTEAGFEPLFPEAQYEDGLSAHLLRLGKGMSQLAPDPDAAGGHYLFVVNGSLVREGRDYPRWSMILAQPGDERINITAGDKGLEVLVMQFPREDA